MDGDMFSFCTLSFLASYTFFLSSFAVPPRSLPLMFLSNPPLPSGGGTAVGPPLCLFFRKNYYFVAAPRPSHVPHWLYV